MPLPLLHVHRPGQLIFSLSKKKKKKKKKKELSSGVVVHFALSL